MSSADALPHTGPFAENAALVGGQSDSILGAGGPEPTAGVKTPSMFGGSRRRRRSSKKGGSKRKSRKGGRRRRSHRKH